MGADMGAVVPLIVTAAMERDSHARFDALRRRHYPPERLQVPAHVTLFHQLPGSLEADVAARLKALARGTDAPEAEVVGPYSLGRGVAYRLRSPGLEEVRDALIDAWWTLLTSQDRQGFRPHVTVQNKAEPSAAKALLAELQAGFAPWRFRFTGLELWRYRGGPWEAAGSWRFARVRAAV